MRARDRILANLEELYRETYERARESGDQRRVEELDAAYVRDQLMLEILLDIRDLFSVAPAAPAEGHVGTRAARVAPPPDQTSIGRLTCIVRSRAARATPGFQHSSWQAFSSACTKVPEAGLVAYGRVWTGNPDQPWAGGVAMRGDTVLAVGDSADVARYVGTATEVVSAAGAMIVPGFMDGHTHFLDGGFQLASVDLRTADTPEEFTARIKAFAAERKPGDWILGGDWDHERWPGTPLPTKAWIDSVTPDNPVFVNRLDGHMAVANTAALRAAGVTRATKDVPGGEIVRSARHRGADRGAQGQRDDRWCTARCRRRPSAQQDAALARAVAFAGSKGVTAVNYMSAPTTWLGAFQRAQAAGTLTVRVKMFFPVERWRWVADTVAAAGPGDDWLRIDGVKGYMDGSLGSTTALFFDPYLDAPGTRGLGTTDVDSMRRYVQAADSAQLQVAVHAIGDRANALLLDLYDSVSLANGARDRRFRIEHAQHLRPVDITRIATMNVIPSMQPYHVIDDGRWAAKRLDSTRLQTTYAFRDLIDQGAHLDFGSDWTVAPLDPLLGIYAAVTRRTLDDKNPDGWFPAQKVTVEEALRAYTVENAYGVFAEGRRGVLEARRPRRPRAPRSRPHGDSPDRHPERARAGDGGGRSGGVPGALMREPRCSALRWPPCCSAVRLSAQSAPGLLVVGCRVCRDPRDAARFREDRLGQQPRAGTGSGAAGAHEGTLSLLTPVGGRTMGAVFAGEGRSSFPRGSDRSRHNSPGSTNGPSYRVPIVEVLLFFSDTTLAELERHREVRARRPPGPRRQPGVADTGPPGRRPRPRGRPGRHDRSAQRRPGRPVLRGHHPGRRRAPAVPRYPAGAGGRGVAGAQEHWVDRLFDRASVKEAPTAAGAPALRGDRQGDALVRHYALEVSLPSTGSGDIGFRASARMFLYGQGTLGPWMVFTLADQFRVDSAKWSDGRLATFDKQKDSPYLWVRLPAPSASGGGGPAHRVLPRRPHRPLRRFLLHRRIDRLVPAPHGRAESGHVRDGFSHAVQLLFASVGERMDTSTTDRVTTSRWVTPRPIRNASFNVGMFKSYQPLEPGAPPVTVLVSESGHRSMGSKAYSSQEVTEDIARSMKLFTTLVRAARRRTSSTPPRFPPGMVRPSPA